MTLRLNLASMSPPSLARGTQPRPAIRDARRLYERQCAPRAEKAAFKVAGGGGGVGMCRGRRLRRRQSVERREGAAGGARVQGARRALETACSAGEVRHAQGMPSPPSPTECRKRNAWLPERVAGGWWRQWRLLSGAAVRPPPAPAGSCSGRRAPAAPPPRPVANLPCPPTGLQEDSLLPTNASRFRVQKTSAVAGHAALAVPAPQSLHDARDAREARSRCHVATRVAVPGMGLSMAAAA